MEDYHVDRLGVEVPQGMKLTSTNSSIGLIVLIIHDHHIIRRRVLFNPPSVLRAFPGTPADWRYQLASEVLVGGYG